MKKPIISLTRWRFSIKSAFELIFIENTNMLMCHIKQYETSKFLYIHIYLEYIQ